jgi:medium-chain acyl-[acyl-carrier-protein] hydrolase
VRVSARSSLVALGAALGVALGLTPDLRIPRMDSPGTPRVPNPDSKLPQCLLQGGRHLWRLSCIFRDAVLRTNLATLTHTPLRTATNHNPVTIRFAPNPSARLRLLCFASAGSTAAFYRRWTSLLPSTVEVCGVELPGRGIRWREPLLTRFEDVMAGLVAAVLPLLDKPTAFFGHSLGGFLSFELTRNLRNAGLPLPRHLFISGTRSPRTPRREGPLSKLPDDEFLAYLHRLNGTPERILNDEGAMEIYLPILRADARLFDSYQYEEQPPLPVPIAVFGGSDDPEVSTADLEPWREQTSMSCSIQLFPGGHFYLREHEAQFVQVLSTQLWLLV